VAKGLLHDQNVTGTVVELLREPVPEAVRDDGRRQPHGVSQRAEPPLEVPRAERPALVLAVLKIRGNLALVTLQPRSTGRFDARFRREN